MSERKQTVHPWELPPEERQEDEPSFLSRWSRRKTGVDAEVSDLAAEATEVSQPTESEVPEEKIDARTGKPFSELTDADMPDLDALDENSDVSAFMAEKVSPALRMKALSRIFRSAKYNKVCLCAEYADDYTNFTPMGDIIPHDMKRAIVREANKLRERLSEKGLEMSPEEAEARIAAEARGEKLPDIEGLSEREVRQETEAAERERPDRLHS
ncbi:MAG: DUF3306 domain-containing protein [Ectothiorhodospiraceae bacterium]|nr:DUF3306 domain-containing protein [Ectothiorhodospiraceae bacterium]